MITRMDTLERNMNELKEMKNTIRELHEACTSFNSQIDQAEERISEIEDQLNEIKRETKNREKSAKRNEQSLQEMWDYVKRPNLGLIGVPDMTKRMNPSWKYSSGNYPRKFPPPSKTGQHSNAGNTENTTEIFCKKSNPKAHNCQIQHG